MVTGHVIRTDQSETSIQVTRSRHCTCDVFPITGHSRHQARTKLGLFFSSPAGSGAHVTMLHMSVGPGLAQASLAQDQTLYTFCGSGHRPQSLSEINVFVFLYLPSRIIILLSTLSQL